MSRRYIGSLIDAFNTLKVANAPTIGTVGATIAKACVSFTAPSCVGGGAITSYTAVSCPNFKTGTGTTSPITVACLTNCTAYTFKVSANNAFGPSAFSAASSSATPSASGNLAIFALGYSNSPNGVSTRRNKYIYSGCVNSCATAASAASQDQSAAGNSTTGIFVLGHLACSVATTARNKYTYATDANGSATSATLATYGGSAAGNSTVGIFHLGATNAGASSIRNRYVYSGCVVSVGTASRYGAYYGGAAGTCSFGIFALGYNSPCCGPYRCKYTYSSCTNAAATNSTYAGAFIAATGNSTVGIFAMGYAPCASPTGMRRCKYTYSSNANTSATAARCGYPGAAAGNSTVGIFALGGNSLRDKYTYSGDTSVAATASSYVSSQGSAASNGTTGVNV